ncbi:hypothetical protein CHGG_08877 [Chaetomium globosum CBS 148.51]|uniref:Uncharacterized protein n=1 Tax=Chaetomium globosum (strain ATCC 6205 / CBS 148.51 / DSM 1962 / NBRC 6347 / NRRL 1970) TaxID=306901 RepID=Q2GT27_CHAGB|nr:uncharacterized protein CHGG_08877 [Chaetomium globosum CBS 148.51]EAQ84863.1 hypothetical protein CHGG_08877 [Chaetomium globosum CBS 148.51]
MPDLNSVPPSPHALAGLSRRASSQQMPPPPAPGSPSLNILPSNQSTVNASIPPSLPSPGFQASTSFPGPTMNDNTGVGPGPGPLRHPRPLTAADLHLELEKEQEAVVNRLTRELSILRAAQNASVVSNASSTSASASGTEPGQWGDMSQPSLGTSHYQPVRHQRTSSSASARSLTANAGSVSTTSLAGISSPVPVRPTAQTPIAIGGIALSRQNSSASRRSRTGSPSPAAHRSSSSSHPYHHHHATPGSEPGSLPGYFTSRMPMPMRSQSGTGTGTTPTSAAITPITTTTASELSPGILPATSRYEETALRRAELDEYKRENEALRRRVRELERLVRDAAALKEQSQQSQPQQAQSLPQQQQQVARQRAVSTASAAGSAVGVGVPEEEVGVGESAASGGAGRGRRVGRGE